MEEPDSNTSGSSEAEMSDSSLDQSHNSDSSYTIPKFKEKKGSLPKKPIDLVKQTLQKLVNDDIHVMENKSAKEAKSIGKDFYCIEDTFLTKDLKVYVEDLGEIPFPLKKDSIEKMIEVSSKAKFGKGRETLLDTNVRDTQKIPENKLKVEINNSSLDDLLKRVGAGLNIGKGFQLNPHLHNLLIYGPGQFFKKHTDSEKIQNMIATLVIVLPYPHDGGELIIEHNKKKHVFFGSKNPEVAKCVAFYADCAHEIKKVIEGYRVAITYNIVLQPPEIPDMAEVSEPLDVAVDNYFKSGERKLVFGLNHSYSQKSLRWHLLKGADRTRANALLAVAKKQGRIPCLALTTYHEVYDKESVHYYFCGDTPELIDEETSIDFMIDENNAEFKCASEDDFIDNGKEFCCTMQTKDLFKAYKTEASGPTGNEGDTEENWYRRACLVLWSSRWMYAQGFKEALNELHQLTKQDGNQKILVSKINEIKTDLAQPKKWAKPTIADMLLDIVIYTKSEELARFFFGDLCWHIMNEDHVDKFVQLEKMFCSQAWNDIVKIWKKQGYCGGWNTLVSDADVYTDKYMELVGEQFRSVVVDAILEERVKRFVEVENRKMGSKYKYNSKREDCIETLGTLMRICSVSGKKSLAESLINHVITVPYSAVSLGELYCKLIDQLKPELLTSFEPVKVLATKAIKTHLSELLNETGWAFPVKVTCDCITCSSVLKFFASKSQKSFAIEGPKKTYDHISRNFDLNVNSLSCKFSHVREGRKHKMTFEKLPQLLRDRNKLNEVLLKFKGKIESIEPLLFVSVKVENEDGFDENPSDVSKIEITENIKTELQDVMDQTVGQCSSTEEVYIKSEVTEEDFNNSEREEIPTKRRKI